MMNNLTIVGRLVSEIKEKENNYIFTIAVPRYFKNADGEYETDFFEIRAYKGIGETTKEYCIKGDLIGIKGRLQTETIETNDLTIKKTFIVAERISFLSSSKKEDE